MNTFIGTIRYYRLYDIGQEVDLIEATRILTGLKAWEKFRLKRPSKAMVIEQAPLVITLGTFDFDLLGETFTVESIAKLWNFGALSICFKIDIEQEIAFEHLKKMAIFIEGNENLENQTLEEAQRIVKDLGKAIREPGIWDQSEDYLIYNYKPNSYQGINSTLNELLDKDYFYQLILTDGKLIPSKQTKEAIISQALKYSEDDLVVVDWNSAFVCSEGDSPDICDVLEFAICQLLEMRYYDELLDRKLSELYKSIQDNPDSSILTSSYAKSSKEAALIYIEISEIVEKIENALKVIGDFYYAKVFRIGLERFRFKDWQQSVNNKLKNLAEVSMLFQNEIDEKRNQLMEAIIIILIAIEVVPFLYSGFLKLIGQ